MNLIEQLTTISLFQNMKEEHLHKVLNHNLFPFNHYHKGDILYHAYDKITSFGIIISGSLQIIKEEQNGNRNIINRLARNELFAEVFIIANITKLPFTILALEDSDILWIPSSILHQQDKFSAILMQNLLQILAKKNLFMRTKNEYLSCHSIRERLLRYFYDLAMQQQSSHIVLPFQRQELADFLCVERSAMCRELGRMKKEGLITYQKHKIDLKKSLEEPL